MKKVVGNRLGMCGDVSCSEGRVMRQTQADPANPFVRKSRMCPLSRWLCYAVSLCLAIIMLPGCSKTPHIANSEWEYVRVVYLVREENDNLEPRVWHSKDRNVLRNLQAEFPRGGECFLHSKPHLSRVNRVDIKLTGGQWWSLSYFPDSGNIGIIDPLAPKRTFILKHGKPKMFFAALTNEIMRISGHRVDLDTKIRSRKEAETLGKNDAAWYMWQFH